MLVLSAYEASQWKLEVSEGVPLKRVIASGYHRQSVVGVPKDIPVEIYSHDDGQPFFATYAPEAEGYAAAVRRIRELTGQEIVTFLGRYEGRVATIVLGRENAMWRLKAVRYELESALREASAENLDPRVARIAHLKFKALHFEAPPPQAGLPRAGQSAAQPAEFTIRGPLADSIHPRGFASLELLADPKSGTHFGRDAHSLMRFDPASGETTQLKPGAGVPRPSWLTALALDTRRHRLVISSTDGGRGYLHAYDIEKETWSLIHRPGLESAALVYAPEEDAFYALSTPKFGGEDFKADLMKLNGHCAFVRSVPLREPPTGLALLGHPDRLPPQLRYVGGYLALIYQKSLDRDGNGQPLPQAWETEIRLIDPATGETLYKGRSRKHVLEREFTADERGALWRQLGTADEALADTLCWRLSAGRDAVVRFLDAELTAPPADAASIAKWIAQLDDNQFANREAAFDRLSAQGLAIEPLLRDALSKTGVQAIQSSLKRLLESQDRRGQRAVETLRRIGTPSATSVLEKIARGPETPRSRAAEAALKAP